MNKKYQVHVLADAAAVAAEAARLTAAALHDALAAHGEAAWVLAGGTSPMAAYAVLVADYLDELDWSKVVVLMGDERVVPLEHANSNWGTVSSMLDQLGIPDENRLVPPVTLGPEAAAEAYDQAVSQITRFDMVWLGVGEDGHTLSLFPGRAVADDRLVAAVYDSPKPPPERITLTLRALHGRTRHCLILAAGQNKAAALGRALAGEPLPIARAAQAVETTSSQVTWLLDKAAASKIVN